MVALGNCRSIIKDISSKPFLVGFYHKDKYRVTESKSLIQGRSKLKVSTLRPFAEGAILCPTDLYLCLFERILRLRFKL